MGTSKNSFRESFSAKTDCKTLEGIRDSFLRILRQISVTEPRLCAFDLACLRKNESPRFTKRIFRGAHINYSSFWDNWLHRQDAMSITYFFYHKGAEKAQSAQSLTRIVVNIMTERYNFLCALACLLRALAVKPFFLPQTLTDLILIVLFRLLCASQTPSPFPETICGSTGLLQPKLN